MNQPIPNFESEDDAFAWMLDEVDDPCVDGHRFAFKDDGEAMSKYNYIYEGGCCGFFDTDVTINGRLASIGCNYGH